MGTTRHVGALNRKDVRKAEESGIVVIRTIFRLLLIVNVLAHVFARKATNEVHEISVIGIGFVVVVTRVENDISSVGEQDVGDNFGIVLRVVGRLPSKGKGKSIGVRVVI